MNNTPKAQRLTLSVLSTLVCLTFACAFAHADQTPSILTDHADIAGFGKIAYRPALANHTGPLVVLVHGIYGGASHRDFSELTKLLDDRGARVVTFDLPGVGESDKPRREYTMADVDQALTAILTAFVKEPAIVVTEQILSLSALEVSKHHPELFSRLVLLNSPGVLYLAGAPSQRQKDLYTRIMSDDKTGLSFYQSLLQPDSVRFFLKQAYHDPALVTDARVDDITATAQILDQRWITFSFAGGNIYRSFADASAGVFIPVRALFGEFQKSPTFSGPPETLDLFKAIRPDFDYVLVKDAGGLVQREKPTEVADAILSF